MSGIPSSEDAPRHSFYEATARQRVRGLFDKACGEDLLGG